MARHDNLVLRKINIQSWKSPVARQYKIQSIPHFMLYNPQGQLVQQGFKVYQDILKWK